MSAILGINCFSHDTSAALMVDGQVVAIGEQERFNRDVHTKSFPDDAIAFCLRQAGITASDLDNVAFAHHVPLDLARGLGDAAARMSPKRAAAQLFTDSRLLAKERAFRKTWSYRGPALHIGHHQAHAASAFYASRFDKAAVLTLDRGGDFLSTTMSIGEGNRLREIGRVRNPHSLGEIYSAFTWLLGFTPNGDEGKLMGLAPYGRRTPLVEDVREVVELTPDGRFRVNFAWFRYQREGGWFSKKGLSRYGPRREPESAITSHHEDLAFAVQDLLEEAALHVARALHEATGLTRLCLAGGVALNSVMNARILKETGFEEVYIQPAAGDAGNAYGACAWAWHQAMAKPRSFSMDHAFWGPTWDEASCAAALESAGLPFSRVNDAERQAASRLAEGKVVGWFQGPAEIGPRALGARSILADPRRAEMKDVVNARVKRREGFRPFAPSVLDEKGSEYFEDYTTNPFMLLVIPVRPNKRDVIPAVTHVDGSARMQSVTRDFNEPYYRLISEFDALTGVPVVLNTSFNVRGEPIVNRPEEAINDYVNSDMDSLVLGPFVTDKPPKT